MLVGDVPVILLQLEKVLEMHFPAILRPKNQELSLGAHDGEKLN